MDAAERDVQETTVTAGFSGTLGSVNLVEGRLVSANEKLAELVDQDQKGASLVLHPDDIGLIDKDICKLPLRGDEKMLRGNLKLSHSGGWVEKGSEVVLDELRVLIDEFSDEQPETKRG